MSAKSKRRAGHERRFRERLFEEGNVLCPICLSVFSRQEALNGGMTIEHAPPKAIGGSGICLTCKQCNEGASLIDQHAYLSKKARADWSAGRGVPLVVNFFGEAKKLRFIPENPNASFPYRKHMFRNGKVDIGPIHNINSLDSEKGLAFQIPYRDDYEFVSMIKAAYLMVFSLMGRRGYKFAKNVALEPVREQIMNPNKKILKGKFVIYGSIPRPKDKRLIHLFLTNPPCWMVPLWDDRIVVLPCGGSEPIDEIKFDGDESSISLKNLPFWASCRFIDSITMGGSVSVDSDVKDGSLVGCISSSPHTSMNGDKWSFIVVYHHDNQYIAIPCPLNTQEEKNIFVGFEMAHNTAAKGRGLDRSTLVGVSQELLQKEWPIKAYINHSTIDDESDNQE